MVAADQVVMVDWWSSDTASQIERESLADFALAQAKGDPFLALDIAVSMREGMKTRDPEHPELLATSAGGRVGRSG